MRDIFPFKQTTEVAFGLTTIVVGFLVVVGIAAGELVVITFAVVPSSFTAFPAVGCGIGDGLTPARLLGMVIRPDRGFETPKSFAVYT